MKKYLFAALGLALMACGAKKSIEEGATPKPKEFKKVRTEQVNNKRFDHFIEVNGTIDAVEIANISPEMNGQIKEISVKEGQRVEKGTLLLSLNTRAIESSIREVKTGLELSTKLYEKQKELWDQKIGSEIQYLQAKSQKESLEAKLETLKAQFDMSKLKAPFDGIVDKINVKVGEMASPASPAINFINLDKMKVVAEVSESYLASIKKGSVVKLNVPSYPDFELDIPVYRTGNIINKVNRTFEVELRLSNKNSLLKPNMMAVLHINDATVNDALIVPSIIIKEDSKGKFLFRINNSNVVSKTYVKTGLSYLDQTQIIDGVNAGDKVIVDGYNMISNGDSVEVVE